MKTKKILTLLIAMTIGVIVSAQDCKPDYIAVVQPSGEIVYVVDNDTKCRPSFSLFSQIVRIWSIPEKPVYQEANPDFLPESRITTLKKEPGELEPRRPRFNPDIIVHSNSRRKHFNH